MRRIWLLLCAVVLVAAACGDDGGGNPFGAGDDGSVSSDTGGGDGGGDDSPFSGGDGGDFCATVDRIENGIDFDFSDPASVEEGYGQIVEAAERAASQAPSEIRDDVSTLVDGTKQFYEALRGVDFDFEQLDEADFLALSDEMEAASDRVNAFCGFDDPASDDGGAEDSFEFEDDGISVGGGGDIPDDFPDELVPPSFDDVTTISIAGTRTVSFTITDADYPTVRDHYLGVLGDPAFELNSGDGATASWTIGDPTTGQNVSVFDGGDGSVLVTATDLSGG